MTSRIANQGRVGLRTENLLENAGRGIMDVDVGWSVIESSDIVGLVQILHGAWDGDVGTGIASVGGGECNEAYGWAPPGRTQSRYSNSGRVEPLGMGFVKA